MGVTKHGSNLIQITRLGAFSCFLVKENDGFSLIDTGLPGSAKMILDTANALGAPIRRILLTHAHTDHAGSLDALSAKLPDVSIMISSREARLLARDFRLETNEPQNKLRGTFNKTKTQPTQLLQDGERIGSLEVVASSGHTPGHVSFFDTRDGTLISGDAFANVSRTIVTGSLDLLFPFIAFATWDNPRALESAKRLLALEPSRLAASHGAVLEQPQAAMRRAIEEVRFR